MPLMKFNLPVRYPTHSQIFAEPGDVKDVPEDMVERFLKRGAVLHTETPTSELTPEDEGKKLDTKSGSDSDLLGENIPTSELTPEDDKVEKDVEDVQKIDEEVTVESTPETEANDLDLLSADAPKSVAKTTSKKDNVKKNK